MTDRRAGVLVCDEAGCRALLLAHYREKGIDAHVTTISPIIATEYDPLAIRCPHGVTWYAQPTGEQITEWTRTRTP